MALRQRLAHWFEDSPTYGRDRANLISGFNIGIAGLLLNFTVLLLVMPLLLDPDDRSFRELSENLEFGQLLALILLGGATAFATILIPLRMVTVFWGQRTGRYFDQIVLSGISPLRFVIGKATSQNLFVALILFLLLPYFVLSITLGGVDLVTFLAGLFVLWLYCIALAMVTIWAALYFNELFAALLVIWCAGWLCGLGCIPMQPQPFVLTPFPVLLQPVYASVSNLDGEVTRAFWPMFFACTGGIIGVIGLSLIAIHLGPLYGIVRENSTFGEVVRSGDSQRKRWVRLRLHIQRPSEVAFFYENRSPLFLRNEGLLRWGFGFAALSVSATIACALFIYAFSYSVRRGVTHTWFAYEFHAFMLTIHGFSLAFAVIAFSHTKNTTFLRVPFVFGWKVQVSRLDTIAFLLFSGLSLAAAFLIPRWFDQWSAPQGVTLFSTHQTQGSRTVDFARVAVEGQVAFFIAGLVIYAWQRLLCLYAWMRSSAVLIVAALYFFGICLMPLLIGAMALELRELRDIPVLSDWAPELMMMSPFVMISWLFSEFVSPQFPADISTAPFYLFHYVLLSIALIGIHRRSGKVRATYLTPP
jgi:hypothetical protein